MAVLDVVEVAALIDAPIRPAEPPRAVHAVPFPLALVAASIAPGVRSLAMDVIVPRHWMRVKTVLHLSTNDPFGAG